MRHTWPRRGDDAHSLPTHHPLITHSSPTHLNPRSTPVINSYSRSNRPLLIDHPSHTRTADTQHGANCALVGCRPESAFEKPGQAKWSLYKRRAQTARGVLRSPSISRLDPSPLFNATRYGGERRSHLPSETKKQKIGREHQRGGRGAKGRRSPSATL